MIPLNLDPAVDAEKIDAFIDSLNDKKDEWAQLPAGKKLQMLLDVRASLKEYAQEWVDLSVQAKRIDPNSPWVGEEWISGPWATAAGINGYIETVAKLAAGKKHLPKKITVNDHGKTVAHVYPGNMYSFLITNGVTAEVWMQDGVTPHNLVNHTSVYYDEPNPQGKVTVVLSPGNINAIAPLDALYKLIAYGEVVILKMSPVNEYLGPILEKIFASFIEAGYLRLVYGGGEVGSYLVNHPDIDSVHITGSVKTHNRILYGLGEEGKARMAENDPILTKPITSELGGITPIIVVPGPWTDADIHFNAELIATAKLHNAGCNCVAAQVIVTDKNWDKRQKLLDAIRHQFEKLSPREPYYPGAEKHVQDAVDQYPEAETFGSEVPRVLITDLDPDAAEACYTDEYFTTVLGETALDADSPADFMQKAVEFVNNKLSGTLGASILIHPKTEKRNKSELEQSLADLRYGAVAVNHWSGVAFLLAECAWGGAPGTTYEDIQSGIGVVHNTYLFEKVEKSVVRGSFYKFPRGILHGDFHFFPRPPWFVTNKTAATTGKRVAYFAMDPGARHLPGIFISALRGM